MADVSKRQKYRIKGIPGPTGTIRGETGVVKDLNQFRNSYNRSKVRRF
jgi:hypothetical protein